MSFRQRLMAWAVTGFLQQVLLLGAGAAAALIFVVASLAFFGSIAVRIALPTVEREIDESWGQALGPLDALPTRYPPVATNTTARRVENHAARIGICLAADPVETCPDPEAGSEFLEVHDALEAATRDGDSRLSSIHPVSQWLANHSDDIRDLLIVLLDEERPIWGLDIGDCQGDLDTDLAGQIDLQRVLSAAFDTALHSTVPTPPQSHQILEASWWLNDSVLRSPGLSEHLASIEVVRLQMKALTNLPDPANHWTLRLAATDLRRQALDAYRFESWRLHCRASSFLSNVHPVFGFITSPFARWLAIQQYRAMAWAIDELPRRPISTFDPDAFVSDQHAMVSRWNSISRSALPLDWNSWPATVNAALEVELAQRVLDLRRTLAKEERPAIAVRQPSTVADVVWLYESSSDAVQISLDVAAHDPETLRHLRATVPMSGTQVGGH